MDFRFRRGEALAAKTRRTKSKARTKLVAPPKPAARRKKLKIAIAGFGTVGQSVVKLLCGEASGAFELTHIFNRDVARKKVDWVPASVRWSESINEVISSDIDIFVELAGGVQPAGDWIRKALRAGKSVVTANKQLIAESGPELVDLARESGRRLEFGASVAGGIPAIMGIQEGLAGDRLFKIAGVLNGTCNFILTKMEATGASFESALREAQELGYAEADPTNDVEGYDARAKLVILAQAGLRARLQSDQIPCWPISAVEAVDFAYARELNCTIRQISLAKKETDDGLSVRAFVRPALVPAASLVAHVEGSKNLVMATGQYAGQMVFSGFGAGGDPTAVAVVSDLYSIARSGAGPSSGGPDIETPKEVSGEFTAPYYLRFVVKDRAGIIAAVATVLSRYGIGIDAVLQRPGYPHSALPFIITLETCRSAMLGCALQEINRLDFHVQPVLCMPILVD
jgi:homoserine dehydrogenase